MMLASGRLVPQSGKCLLFGQDIAKLSEQDKNLVASVIYQNMEFESTQKVSELLMFVYKSGTLKGNANGIRGKDLLAEVIQVFELDTVLNHSLTQLSKGEIQRVLLAFSLLYGSASIFMDEPLFAMENRQKETALAYLKEFSVKKDTAIFISMHELDLTKRYADKVILFYPNRNMDYGTPEEVMTDQDLEKAYGVPVTMLKNGEDMTRAELQQTSDAILQIQRQTKK